VWQAAAPASLRRSPGNRARDWAGGYLTGNAAGREVGFDPMATLNRALEGDGIACTEGFLVVLSPHQHNPAMRLRIEVYESEPPDDLDDWEEAFEAWLPLDESGVVYESLTDRCGTSTSVERSRTILGRRTCDEARTGDRDQRRG
jgi:hypothetical protein